MVSYLNSFFYLNIYHEQLSMSVFNIILDFFIIIKHINIQLNILTIFKQIIFLP